MSDHDPWGDRSGAPAPGPWRLGGIQEYAGVKWDGVVLDANGELVMSAVVARWSPETVRTRGRLGAAALLMYEALEAVEGCYCSVGIPDKVYLKVKAALNAVREGGERFYPHRTTAHKALMMILDGVRSGGIQSSVSVPKVREDGSVEDQNLEKFILEVLRTEGSHADESADGRD